MEILIVDDYDELSRRAAEVVEEVILNKPNAVLGLATGNTPIGMYRELIRKHKEKGLDFSQVTTFNLDEYVGISSVHPQSYHSFMNHHLFSQINISNRNVHIPRGDVDDLEFECKLYEDRIASTGGIDIQVLGIGRNGHIGFNEPGSDPETLTRVVHLTDSTIQANARYFSSIDQVPRLAISMGIQTILKNSKHIILLASGEDKSESISRMVTGQATPDVPASLLEMHPAVTIIVERKAAKYLPMPLPVAKVGEII